MHPTLKRHKTAIAALCRRIGVARLEVFGSAVRSDFDENRSDFDVVVQFSRRRAASGLRQYFHLKQGLEAILGRPVDLVELSAMQNTRLRRLIESTKVPLYAAAA